MLAFAHGIGNVDNPDSKSSGVVAKKAQTDRERKSEPDVEPSAKPTRLPERPPSKGAGADGWIL